MSVCRSFVVLPSKDGMDDKGSFNNYVDKMRGEGVKECMFLSTPRV